MRTPKVARWTGALLIGCLAGILFLPCSKVNAEESYKKVLKHLKKYDVKQIPDNKEYPGAEAIVVYDQFLKHQFYGTHCLWDLTWQEEQFKVWKIVNPDVDRLKTVVLDLADDSTLDEFELTITPPVGDDVTIKKAQVQIKESETSSGLRKVKQAVVTLPKLTPDSVLEMEYIIKHDRPLYYDKMFIGGPDPINSFYWGLTLPEFSHNAPTSLYKPVAMTNPFLLRFRGFDATSKKFLTQKEGKEGFYFAFEKIPAMKPGPNSLPLANVSSFVSFSLNELIIKDPLGKYDEKFEDYMQIPEDTPQTHITSAGSPEGYKIPFESWDSVANFVYSDLLDQLAGSQLFVDAAKKIIGEQSIEGLKIKQIYDYLTAGFQLVADVPATPYVPTIKELETSLQQKSSLRSEAGFILWGLLTGAGINVNLALGFTQDQYFGEYDRKFSLPTAFNVSMVTTGTDAGLKVYFPGDPTVRMGNYPPEIAGCDFLIITRKSEAELQQEPATKSDPKNSYIKVKKMTRVKTIWQGIDAGNPKTNKVFSKFEISVGDADAISTSGTFTFTGFKEVEQRRMLKGLDEAKATEKAKEWVGKLIPGATIDSVKISNLDKPNSDLSYAVKLASLFTVKNDKITIPYAFINEKEMLPFNLNQDQKPPYLLLPYRFLIAADVMTTFEKGWKIASSPAIAEQKAAEGILMVNIRQTEIQFNYQRGYSFTQIFIPEKGVQGFFDYKKKIDELEKTEVLVLERKK